MLLLTTSHLLKPTQRIEAFKMIRERTKEVIKAGEIVKKQRAINTEKDAAI